MYAPLTDMESKASEPGHPHTPSSTITIFSGFEECIAWGSAENKTPPPPVSDNNREFLSEVKETADYLQFEVRDVTLNTHMSQLLEHRFLQNCFSWRIIRIILVFFNVTAEREHLFSTNYMADQHMTLMGLFSPQITTTFSEYFFSSFYHFVVTDIF